MATRTLYPTIVPSLDLNFAGSKTLDPRITFSRASAATYYDGKTVAKAEENLWYPSAPIPGGGTEIINTANAGTAPDGTQTAGLSVPNAVSANHLSGYKNVTVTNAEQVFSFYAKAAGYDRVRAGDTASGRMAATFDLTANTVSNTGGVSYLDSGITDIGSGWKRCWLKFNNNGSPGSALGVTPFPAGGTVNNYGYFTGAGDGVSGVYLWGFQLEQRSQVTAYTPTTTQPITNYVPVLLTAPAGVPRFDHNPVTGESLGLLVEDQRTNLLTYSEFQTGGDGVGLAKASFIFGPSGDYTGAIAYARDTISSYRYKTLSATSGVTYTFSCYVKFDDGGPPVISGTVSSASSDFAINVQGTLPAATAYKIESVGNGLYRVSASATVSADSPSSNNGLIKYASNSARTFKTTGWQLEVGSFPTSYIKTEASQVTRAADSASMTGANFSSWYRQDEGTLTYQARYFATTSATGQVVAALDDNSSNSQNRIMVYKGSNTSNIFAYNGASNVLIGSIVPSVLQKYALAYDLTTITGSSGSAVASTAALTRPTITSLSLGKGSNANQFSGHITRIAYYPKRLSDAQLQALTA